MFQVEDKTYATRIDGTKTSVAQFIVDARFLVPQDAYFKPKQNWSPKTSWYFRWIKKQKTRNYINRLKRTSVSKFIPFKRLYPCRKK